jgi:hypothetical protein
MFLVAVIAVLALPAYIIGVITIPIGLGILMLMNSSPWVLNLYPFLFAGEGHWKAPKYYLDTVVSLPLTILQWSLIAWLCGVAVRDLKPNRVPIAVLALVIAFGLGISLVLHTIRIELIVTGSHM